MVQFTSSSVFANDLAGPLFGIADLDMALFGDQWRLFATNRVESNISVFDVLDLDGPQVTGVAKAVVGGQSAATHLDIVETGNGTFALFGGEGNALHTAYSFTLSGDLGDGVNVAPASGLGTALTAVSAMHVGGANLMASAQEGQAGFTVQSVDADLTPTFIRTVTTGMVADIELVQVGEGGLAIAIDKTNNAVLSFTLDESGVPTAVDTLDVADGLGLVSPEILQIVEVAGQSFGIVAASSSSSISVFEIAETGQLIARDNVIDGQGTRFASISELEVVENAGRAFVLAAGADDGITLLELLPDGRLLHHATIADSEATTLQNVSGLTGEVEDGVLHVFAASETESGLTELAFDLGDAGVVQTGGAGGDTMTGADGDDVLFGGHGADSDEVIGGDGDDILVAGGGFDTLSGGQGTDTFVFGGVVDGGQITDFDVSRDRLDLSGWFRLYDVSQLQFISNGNRLDIGFQGNSVTLYSHDGSTLKASDVADRITINPSHSMISDVPQAASVPEDHFGTPGNDVIFGNAGQDVFYADGGADVYVGGDDFDIVSYENATGRIKADLRSPNRSSGEIAKDTFYSIEGVVGTDFKDVLKGSNDGDWFDGGDSRDVLIGRNGDDNLFGGLGSDKLIGGSGDDQIFGAEGVDVLKGGNGDDLLNGGDDKDNLSGQGGNDTLEGGGGTDRLKGGSGDDHMSGGAGDDKLTGGSGADEFYFIAGNDRITDFKADQDILYISDTLLADPTMTVSEILNAYGQDLGASVRLNFGPDADGENQILTLNGIGNLDLLSDSLFVY